MNLIRRVEIVRGPSSSIYGTSAIFAIVNVITKSSHEYSGIEVAAHAGSYGGYGAGVITTHGTGNSLQWLLSGSFSEIGGQDHYFSEFDDPLTNNGIFVDGDKSRSTRLFGKLDHGPLHAEALFSWHNKKIPTAPWGTIFNDPRTKTKDNMGHFAAWYDGKISPNTSLLGRLTYGIFEYEGSWAYDYADEGEPEWPVVNMDNAVGRWLNLDAQLARNFGNGHMVGIGGEYRNNMKQDQSVWDSDPNWVYTDDRRHGENWALYALGEWRISEAVHLNIGVRQDHYPTFGSSTNPRLALVTHPAAGTVFKTIYGSAFRAPNLYELYYTDGEATQKANPDLIPETIKTLEAVLDQSVGSNSYVSLSVYQYHNRDLIVQVLDPEDGLLVFLNNAEIRALGAEVEFRTQTSSQIKSTVSYSFNEAKFAGSDELLSNSPRHLIKFKLLAPIYGLSSTAGLEIQHLSKRKTLLGNSTTGSTLVNLTLVHAPLSSRYELSAGFYNLFDVDYSHPASSEHTQDSLSQNGLNFRASVVIRP